MRKSMLQPYRNLIWRRHRYARAKGSESFEEIQTGRPNLEEFADTLLDLASRDPDILVMTSDSRGSAKLARFGENCPTS
jgi:hypothetical protein